MHIKYTPTNNIEELFEILFLCIGQKCTGLNEEYSTCASLCPPTCQDKCKSDPTACAAVCVNGCKCKSGFIKDDATGNCIREQDCPTCQS